jgi:hypothetical protein
VVEGVAGETLVYDVERHRAHCLNRPAALIWSACDGTRDSAAIADELAASLPEVSVEMVEIAVSRLARARLLTAEEGLPRRALLRRLSLAAGLMPLVSSIVVPEAAAAASCQPAGGCCSRKADCCPGLNCVGPRLPSCPPSKDKSCR